MNNTKINNAIYTATFSESSIGGNDSPGSSLESPVYKYAILKPYY